MNKFVPIDPKPESSTKRSSALVASSPPKPFNYCAKSLVEVEAATTSQRIDDNQEANISIEVICRNVAPVTSWHYHDCDTSLNLIDQSINNLLKCARCTATCDDWSVPQHSNSNIGKGQTLLTSYFSVLKKEAPSTSPPPDDSFANSECRGADEVQSENCTKAISINWCRVKIVRKYSRLNYRKTRHRHQLQHKLDKIIHKSKRLYARRWHPYRRQPLLLFTFLCLNTYHKYTNELIKMNGLNAPVGRRPVANFGRTVPTAANKSTPIDVVAANKRVQKIVNDMNGGIGSDEVNAKRFTKGNRTAENARMMLLYENQQESSEKDCSE